MPQHLTEDDRQNMCRMVYAERLDQLRRYAKAAQRMIDERKAMDSAVSPIMYSLPEFKAPRSAPPDIIVKLTAKQLTEIWDKIDKLSAEFDLENVDDPYERSPEVEAAYELRYALTMALPKRPKNDEGAAVIVEDAGLCAPS